MKYNYNKAAADELAKYWENGFLGMDSEIHIHIANGELVNLARAYLAKRTPGPRRSGGTDGGGP